MKVSRRIYLYVFLLLAVIVLMMALRKTINREPKAFELRDFPEIMTSGELNVVTDYNTIGYFVSGDSILGFQHEMLKELEKAWNVKVNIFLENSLDENLEGLSSQRYDIVARNIPVNTQLRDTFAFTDAILLNKNVLVQRRVDFNDSIQPIRKHLELAKKTIHVPKGSPMILRLNNLSREIGDTIYVVENETYDTEQLVMMVASGDIDYTVSDEKVAKQLAERLPEIDVVTDISFTQLESWAVRKNSVVLLDSLNNWLRNFKKTRTFEKLKSKYY